MKELAAVFEKDLKKLKEEILQYDSEDRLFKTVEGISNSGGNLAMHLCGNLRHFIGAILGNSAYIRNREEEFAGRVSSQKLIEDIEETILVVKSTLSNLSEEDFSEAYPLQVFGEAMSTRYFLFHLLGHLNYHLGQVNYHRRLITN
jgi:uncharacterized damage-inducible protein DinB